MYSGIAHYTTYNLDICSSFFYISCALVELIDRHQQRKWSQLRRSGATVAWRGSAAVQQWWSSEVVQWGCC
jgi:hypothetical protein